MNVYASGWYDTGGNRNFDHNGSDCHMGRRTDQDGQHWAYRRHKGDRRRKKFHCVNLKMNSDGQYWTGGPSTNHPNKDDYIKWGSGNQGHHPCKNIGESYTYMRNSAFPGAHFGFRCTVPSNKIHSLINGNSSHVNSAGATDSSNNRKTMKDQLLFVPR